ncbi:MAG: DnaD domain protein [Lachnospiraceae bacterium]|nr:DnaD domain protein [Lachnospiraceae bacterium]
MGNIIISSEREISATVVPNVFIDRYMLGANGAYVKVYLYLLRCMSGDGHPFSVEQASEELDETEKDILRALSYWEKAHVLSVAKDKDGIKGITFLDLLAGPSEKSAKAAVEKTEEVRTAQTDAPENNAPIISLEAKRKELYKEKEYTSEELNRLCGEKDINSIMNIASTLLGRFLSPVDQNFILFVKKQLGFSEQLTIYLFDYCCGEKGKRNIEYIKTVAVSWYEEGVTTIAEAEDYNIKYSESYAAVNRAFNLGRLPGGKEKAMVLAWKKKNYSPELIEEACNIALMQTGSPKWNYANKVLMDWEKKGYKTLKEVKDGEAANRSSENGRKNTSYAKTNTNSAVKPAVTKSAAAYNSYPQRKYTEEEYDNLERILLQN